MLEGIVNMSGGGGYPPGGVPPGGGWGPPPGAPPGGGGYGPPGGAPPGGGYGPPGAPPGGGYGPPGGGGYGPPGGAPPPGGGWGPPPGGPGAPPPGAPPPGAPLPGAPYVPPGAPPGGGLPPGYVPPGVPPGGNPGYGPPGGSPPGGGYGSPGGAPPGGGYGPPGGGGGFGGPPPGYGPPGGAPPGGGYGPPAGGPPGWGGPGGFVPPPGGVSPTAPGGPGAWSPTEAYSFAWNAIMKNFGGVALPLAVAVFVGFLPVGIVSGLIQFMMRLALEYVDSSFLGLFAALLYAVIGGLALITFSFLAGGIVEFALKVSRGQRPEFGDVFAGGKYFGSMFVGFVGFGFAMTLGLALCVIPGYMVQFGLWPFAFIIVEERASGIDALKKAWAMTTGHKMSIFIFWLISLVVVIAGELACFLPVLLVSYPMIILASAHMYLNLKGETPRLAQ